MGGKPESPGLVGDINTSGPLTSRTLIELFFYTSTTKEFSLTHLCIAVLLCSRILCLLGWPF